MLYHEKMVKGNIIYPTASPAIIIRFFGIYVTH